MVEDVFPQVADIIADALARDRAEVTPESRLIADLGAESIDFLDIVFRLEKAFDIKIPRGDLFPENLLNNPEFVKEGKLTDAGLAELRARLPYADLSEFEKNPVVGNLGDVYTVDMIVGYIEKRLGA